MASLKVYSYSRCSTCRKALAWLASEGLSADVLDITTTPPDRAILVEAFEQFGQVKPLFNTSGLSYRALGAAAVKAMTDDAAIDALAADGKLIKRPFVRCADGSFLVGFKPEVWADALLN